MQSVEKYQLCVSGDTENLMTRVRTLIEQGWVPVGGVAQFKEKIIQAMVLPKGYKKEMTAEEKQAAYLARKERKEQQNVDVSDEPTNVMRAIAENSNPPRQEPEF